MKTRPCPFCGGTEIKTGTTPHPSSKRLSDPFVSCVQCGAEICLSPDCSEDDAVSRWNTRCDDKLREKIRSLTAELNEVAKKGADTLMALQEAKDDKEVFRDTLEFIINHVAIPENGFYRQEMKEGHND